MYGGRGKDRSKRYTAKNRLRGGGEEVLSSKCGGTVVKASWRETDASSHDSNNKLHNDLMTLLL